MNLSNYLDFLIRLSLPLFLDFCQILTDALLRNSHRVGRVLLGPAFEIRAFEDDKLLIGQFSHEVLKQSFLYVDRLYLSVQLVFSVQQFAKPVLMDGRRAPHPIVDRARYRKHLDVHPVQLLIDDPEATSVASNPFHEFGQGHRSNLRRNLAFAHRTPPSCLGFP